MLVIESDPLTRHVIMLSLEQAGCRVGVAADTAQALEVVDTERFDAIVVHCPTPAAEDLSASLRRHGVSIGPRTSTDRPADQAPLTLT